MGYGHVHVAARNALVQVVIRMSKSSIREACPFCGRVGAQEVSHSPRWGYFVRCACHAVGPSSGSRQGAIDRWNERPEPVQGRLL